MLVLPLLFTVLALHRKLVLELVYSPGRFEKKATFDNNAHNFDGAGGCSVTNEDTSTVM